MQAIPTEYNGYSFRSRLEARWAVFFDLVDWQYVYEPEGYMSQGEKYLPDFFLPDYNIYAEVKGQTSQWKDDIVRMEKFCTVDAPFRGIMLLGEIPLACATGGSSVYWFPFMFYSPLKDTARMTRAVICEANRHVQLRPDFLISQDLQCTTEEFFVKEGYNALLASRDDTLENYSTTANYRIRLSEFPTPVLNNAYAEARKRKFSSYAE